MEKLYEGIDTSNILDLDAYAANEFIIDMKV